MVAQQMTRDRPSIFRRMVLVGTAPRGGDDIMHLEKPNLAQHLRNPALRGYEVLKKLFFVSSPTSQAAGEAFIKRLAQRQEDREPLSGPNVAAAQWRRSANGSAQEKSGLRIWSRFANRRLS
jgi:pimeloyl-ACP methyl ester carboxylesterase